jgi:protein TonB
MSRGMALAISCALHVAVLAAALVVAAHLAPQIEAVIHAELVTPDVDPPRPPAPRAETKAPSQPKTPAVPRPIQVPRLLDAPTAPSPAPIEETPVARPVQTDSVSIAEVPAPKVERVEPPALAEPARADSPGRAGRERGSTPPPAGPPEGLGSVGSVALIPAVEDRSASAAAIGTSGVTGGVRGGGVADRGAGGGSGTGGGLAHGSSAAGTGSGFSRMAIPRGGYQVQPRYPPTARRLGIQGTTLLRVFVASDGRVADVGVERTAGHADLDEAAADAVRRWRFEPARQGDEPVAMWVLLPVEFRLK